MSELLEAALAYAARGWPIFPITPGAKSPPLTKRGVLDASCDPATIRKWWVKHPEANIGLDCGGAGLMVLDFDPGADRAGTLALLGAPATGLNAKTPRGGDHLFYELAPGEIVPPSASKIAPHVDVRSHHSYVLLCPSRTAAGSYAWGRTTDPNGAWNWGPCGKPAFRSEAMIQAASAHREKYAERDQWKIDPDLPANIERAVKWLRTEAAPATEGQGGDNAAYATAAYLRSLGISPETSLDLMREHWNPRCQPPWGAEEIADYFAAKIEHASDYATSPPGNITAAYRQLDTASMFKPVERAAPLEVIEGTYIGSFRMTHDEAISAIVDPPWLIKGYLPQGAYVLLTGAPGAYKSFVALDIARCVSVGLWFPALNWEVEVPGPVLFAAGEGRAPLKHRVEAWRRAFCAERAPFILGDPVPRASNPAHAEAFIAEALDRHPGGYKLIVIDTVGRSMAGMNENASEFASQFTAMVDRFRATLGQAGAPATILAVHHTGHSAKGGAARGRGSSVFEADPDTVLTMERSENAVTLGVHKQKDAVEAADRMFTMRPVNLGPLNPQEPMGEQLVSLVPMPVSLEKVERTREVAKRETKVVKAGMMVIDEALADVLSGNPTKTWTSNALAEAIAMRPEIEIGSGQLRKFHLVELREQADTVANRCYDPAVGRWRWQG